MGTVALSALVLVLWVIYAHASYDTVVQMVERHYGGPGTAHVIPDCSCTMQYRGTTVRGRSYDVHLYRMD